MFLMFLTRSISQRKGRVAIASVSVALAVTVITAMAAITLGIGEKLGSELRAYGANIIISPGEGGYIDAGALERIVVIDDVIEAEGQVLGRGLISGESIEIIGRPMSTSAERGGRLSGELPANRHEVLAGIDLKAALELDLDRKIYLEHGYKRDVYVVKGFIETGSADDRALMMSLPDAWELTGLHDKLSVVLVSGAAGSLDDIVEKIKSTLPGTSVKTFRQVARAEESLLNKMQLLMLLVAAVVLFASIMSVAGTMGANVLERREEIGIMMALGATKNRISLFYMAETVLIGLIGGIAGFALGHLSAQVISKGAFDSFISIPFYVVFLSLVTGLLVPMAAANFPVRNAMKQSPAVILRGE
jgi:putative ABC transport system permease protein